MDAQKCAELQRATAGVSPSKNNDDDDCGPVADDIHLKFISTPHLGAPRCDWWSSWWKDIALATDTYSDHRIARSDSTSVAGVSPSKNNNDDCGLVADDMIADSPTPRLARDAFWESWLTSDSTMVSDNPKPNYV